MRIITNKKVEEIKKYVECPELGFTHYGRWGILNREQRLLINDLCDSWIYHIELLDNYVKSWYELKKWLEANDIHYAEAIPFRETLKKMQELEGQWITEKRQLTH